MYLVHLHKYIVIDVYIIAVTEKRQRIKLKELFLFFGLASSVAVISALMRTRYPRRRVVEVES